MDRPFFQNTIEELEKLVRDRMYDRATLGRVREELSYRETPRARRLMREVQALVEGEVQMPPPPPRPDTPEDQIPLLEERPANKPQ